MSTLTLTAEPPRVQKFMTFSQVNYVRFMYCHGDAGRFECLRIQFGTTHADQNPGTNVSPCIFAPFLYIRSVPQVTLHIRKLGLFQLQHECSHRYICWHCHILRGDKTKNTELTHLYSYMGSAFIHLGAGRNQRDLENFLSSGDGGSRLSLDQSIPQPRGGMKPETFW